MNTDAFRALDDYLTNENAKVHEFNPETNLFPNKSRN
jgi:hypothetical protein